MKSIETVYKAKNIFSKRSCNLSIFLLQLNCVPSGNVFLSQREEGTRLSRQSRNKTKTLSVVEIKPVWARVQTAFLITDLEKEFFLLFSNRFQKLNFVRIEGVKG